MRIKCLFGKHIWGKWHNYAGIYKRFCICCNKSKSKSQEEFLKWQHQQLSNFVYAIEKIFQVLNQELIKGAYIQSNYIIDNLIKDIEKCKSVFNQHELDIVQNTIIDGINFCFSKKGIPVNIQVKLNTLKETI